MAQVDADNRANAENPTGDNILSGGTLGGRVRVMTDVITLAAQSADDTIRLFEDLKDGAIILGLDIDNDTLGAGVLIDVGDVDTPERYIDGYDAEANVTSRAAVSAIQGLFQAAGAQYKVGTNLGLDNTVLATILVAAATGEIKFTLFYTED